MPVPRVTIGVISGLSQPAGDAQEHRDCVDGRTRLGAESDVDRSD